MILFCVAFFVRYESGGNPPEGRRRQRFAGNAGHRDGACFRCWDKKGDFQSESMNAQYAATVDLYNKK